MRPDERTMVLATFLHSCSAELPHNVHANGDLLRRITGFSEGKISRLAGGWRSLGVYARMREDEAHDEYLGRSKTLVLEWHDMSADRNIGGNATGTAYDTVIAASDAYCSNCALPRLQRLDFSGLGTATLIPDAHTAPPHSPMESTTRVMSRARRASSRGR